MRDVYFAVSWAHGGYLAVWYDTAPKWRREWIAPAHAGKLRVDRDCDRIGEERARAMARAFAKGEPFELHKLSAKFANAARRAPHVSSPWPKTEAERAEEARRARAEHEDRMVSDPEYRRQWFENLRFIEEQYRQRWAGIAAGEEKHRRVLGVSTAASAEEIKRAWRKAAAQHHPDRGGDPAAFRRVIAARDALLGAST